MKVCPFAPQKRGHVIMDNSVFDYIMPAIKPNAWKALCFIIRKTKGWHKDKDDISYSQIVAGTGIKSPNTIAAALAELEAGKYIIVGHGVKRGNTWATNSYRLNLALEIDIEPPATDSIADSDTESEAERAIDSVDTKHRNTLNTIGANAPRASATPSEVNEVAEATMTTPEGIAKADSVLLAFASKDHSEKAIIRQRASDNAKALMSAFHQATGLPWMKSWNSAANEMDGVGVRPEHVKTACSKLKQSGMTVADLHSVKKLAVVAMTECRVRVVQPEYDYELIPGTNDYRQVARNGKHH